MRHHHRVQSQSSMTLASAALFTGPRHLHQEAGPGPGEATKCWHSNVQKPSDADATLTHDLAEHIHEWDISLGLWLDDSLASQPISTNEARIWDLRRENVCLSLPQVWLSATQQLRWHLSPIARVPPHYVSSYYNLPGRSDVRVRFT